VTPCLGVAQQAPDFRMIGVPHDQSGEPFGGPAPDDGLNLGYPGAGGIDDAPASLLQQAPFLGRDAVGPDYYQPRRHFFPGLQNGDSPFPQQFQDLGVMDQRAIGVNLGLVFVDGLQDHLQRPLHADAKPGGAGQNYLHRELPPKAAGCEPCFCTTQPDNSVLLYHRVRGKSAAGGPGSGPGNREGARRTAAWLASGQARDPGPGCPTPPIDHKTGFMVRLLVKLPRSRGVAVLRCGIPARI
jgi:hypothetical protein